MTFLPLAFDALLVAALLACALPPGIALVSRLPGVELRERLPLAAVSGFGIVGALLSLLALAHGFDRPRILILVALVAVASWLLRPRFPAERRGATDGSWLLALPLAGAVPVALLLALYPAASFDDTMYHLPLAESLVEHGGTVFEPHLRFPLFPLFQEVWIAALFAVGGTASSAQFFAVAELALFAGLIAAWGKRLGGPRAAALSAALLLGSPLPVWLGSAAYVDLALAIFTVATAWALLRGREPEKSAWLTLAAGFAGLAAATKYHGLLLVAIAGSFALRRAWQERDVRALLGPGAAVLLTAFPWYLRNLLVSGNPVFPFLSTVFGPNAWTLPAAALAGPGGLNLAEPGNLDGAQLVAVLGALVFDLLRLPWLLLVDAVEPATVPPFSPFAALAVPLAAVFLTLRQATRAAGLLCLAYLVVWLAGVRDVRYLLPAAAVLAVLGAAEFAPTVARLKPWAVVGLITVLLAPAWGFAALRVAQRGLPPLTEPARSRYLDRWLPGHALLSCSGRVLGRDATVYGWGTEQLQFYAPGRLLGDWNGPYRYDRIRPLLADAERLTAELRTMDAKALLIPEGTLPANPDPHLTLLGRCRGYELWGLEARTERCGCDWAP